MIDDYTTFELEQEKTYLEREQDWRNGAVVYQIIVDRFVPSQHIEQKKHLYSAPRMLRRWEENPSHGSFLKEHYVWSHEIDFWGGDLQSVRTKIDYLQQLNVDVLYLNPIHSAFTNHKYDAYDYMEISPEYGSWADLAELLADLHACNKHVVLDGVFNHMGRTSRYFQDASTNPDSPYRDWFYFGPQYSTGTRCWMNAPSLPELNLENPEVRDYLYGGQDSVVRSYLRLGVDGWRLDTAYELGFHYLHDLTKSAHQEKPGSLVVGEIVNYPAEWFPAVDGVMNFTLRQVISNLLSGQIAAATAGDMIATMIQDSGIENMLKSWILLDNHDIPRQIHSIPDERDLRLAQVLQFTLPGSPNIYYGSELGMDAGEDPANRAPMGWTLVNDQNQVSAWFRKLINLHRKQRALRIGNYRKIISGRLLAYERYTDRVDEAVVVVINPVDEPVQETVLVPDSKFMNVTRMVDLLESGQSCTCDSGVLRVHLPAKGCLVLKLVTAPQDGYTAYKRVR